MIKIIITSVGKIKDKYIIEGITEYKKRLQKFSDFSIIEIQEESENRGIQSAVDLESDRIIAYLEKQKSFNILLDIEGQSLTSVEMAEKISGISNITSKINFIIGGSNGVNQKLKEIVDFKLSFSPMTFPHQLFRVMLLEQVYRAFRIMKNEPYHK